MTVRGSDPYEANRRAFNVLLSQDPAGIVTSLGASEDIGVAFPPETVGRLRAAKAKYDPGKLFHANHPVVSG